VNARIVLGGVVTLTSLSVESVSALPRDLTAFGKADGRH
jgi:hypothetical protein